MQVINLTTQQTNLKGLITKEFVTVLCDTALGSFVVTMPLANGSIVRQITIKNIGINDLVVSFDYNSQLCVSSGNLTLKTLLADECLVIINDNINSKWYQTNNSAATYSP